MRELPAPDWEQVKVADVIERHFCGPSPDCEERPVFDDAEWGVLKTTAITWSGWNQDAHKALPRAYWGREGIEVKAGDVLVTKAGPRHRVAVVTHVPATRRHLVVSGKMIGLRPRNDLVLPEVLAGLLALVGPQKYIHDRTTGMAESQVNFANDVLLATPLQLPPVPEQMGIAQIAGVLDTTIRQTEAIIEKLRQVKQGLLHDLLTRGIDENGEVRSPQSQSPHLYKESPLGWIPREWRADVLRNALAGIDGGWSPECLEITPPAGHWGVLKLSAITSGRYVPSESKTLPDTLRPDPSVEVREGDVLLARANGVAELVATTVFVDATPDRLMLSDKTLRLRPLSGTLSPRFLAILMAFDLTRRQIRGMLNGSSGQQNISQRQIRNLVVALPPLVEQTVIESRLVSVENRIDAEVHAAGKLRCAKAGLMDDLLTGRVRVTPLLA